MNGEKLQTNLRINNKREKEICWYMLFVNSNFNILFEGYVYDPCISKRYRNIFKQNIVT